MEKKEQSGNNRASRCVTDAVLYISRRPRNGETWPDPKWLAIVPRLELHIPTKLSTFIHYSPIINHFSSILIAEFKKNIYIHNQSSRMLITFFFSPSNFFPLQKLINQLCVFNYSLIKFFGQIDKSIIY